MAQAAARMQHGNGHEPSVAAGMGAQHDHARPGPGPSTTPTIHGSAPGANRRDEEHYLAPTR